MFENNRTCCTSLIINYITCHNFQGCHMTTSEYQIPYVFTAISAN